MLAVPHQGFPFALFKLLEDPDFAELAVRMPDCLRGDFAELYMKAHDYLPERLRSFVSICCLRALAEMIRLDTARVESGHSLWQREARARGLQTVADALVAVSGTFVIHRQRASEAALVRRQRMPRKRGRKPDKQSAASKRKAKAKARAAPKRLSADRRIVGYTFVSSVAPRAPGVLSKEPAVSHLLWVAPFCARGAIWDIEGQWLF